MQFCKRLKVNTLRMSDSDSESEPKYELQPYTLVRFIHRGRKRKVESIDLVPSKWLHFDKIRGRCVTKFMEAPYSEEDLELLHTLIINNVEAPEDWPTFPVDLVGRALTYREGLKKLGALETQDHVLTLESEDSASEAQRELALAVKRQKLLTDAKKTEAEMSLPNESAKTESDQSNAIANDSHDKAGQSEITSSVQKKTSQDEPCASENIDDQVEPSTSRKTCDKGKICNSKKNTDQVEPSTSKKNTDQEVRSTSKGFHHPVKLSSRTKSVDGVQAIVDIVEPSTSFMPQLTLPTVSVTEDTMDNEDIMAAPIIHLENVKCNSEFETAVIMRLDNLCSDMQKMKSRIDEMNEKQNEMVQEMSHLKVLLEATSNFLSDNNLKEDYRVDFENKYQMVIPLTTYEEFEAFEQQLKVNKFFKKDVCIKLRSKVAKDYSITKSMVQMMKYFFTKNLANQFTAIRNSSINKNKYKFKPTILCSLIEGVISKMRSEKLMPTTTDELNSSLSDVLTNVYKWKNTD